MHFLQLLYIVYIHVWHPDDGRRRDWNRSL